jgi:hypothetical protein
MPHYLARCTSQRSTNRRLALALGATFGPRQTRLRNSYGLVGPTPPGREYCTILPTQQEDERTAS